MTREMICLLEVTVIDTETKKVPTNVAKIVGKDGHWAISNKKTLLTIHIPGSEREQLYLMF